eukprot:scaffold9999_cov68-Phaeocystis_antarctica.AAC.3
MCLGHSDPCEQRVRVRGAALQPRQRLHRPCVRAPLPLTLLLAPLLQPVAQRASLPQHLLACERAVHLEGSRQALELTGFHGVPQRHVGGCGCPSNRGAAGGRRDRRSRYRSRGQRGGGTAHGNLLALGALRALQRAFGLLLLHILGEQLFHHRVGVGVLLCQPRLCSPV